MLTCVCGSYRNAVWTKKADVELKSLPKMEKRDKTSWKK